MLFPFLFSFFTIFFHAKNSLFNNPSILALLAFFAKNYSVRKFFNGDRRVLIKIGSIEAMIPVIKTGNKTINIIGENSIKLKLFRGNIIKKLVKNKLSCGSRTVLVIDIADNKIIITKFDTMSEKINM